MPTIGLPLHVPSHAILLAHPAPVVHAVPIGGVSGQVPSHAVTAVHPLIVVHGFPASGASGHAPVQSNFEPQPRAVVQALPKLIGSPAHVMSHASLPAQPLGVVHAV